MRLCVRAVSQMKAALTQSKIDLVTWKNFSLLCETILIHGARTAPNSRSEAKPLACTMYMKAPEYSAEWMQTK